MNQLPGFRSIILFAAFLFSFQALSPDFALAQGKKKGKRNSAQLRYGDYYQRSLSRIAELTGSSQRSLVTFMESIRLRPGERYVPVKEYQPYLPGFHPCIPKDMKPMEALESLENDELLNCLAQTGRQGFTFELFQAIRKRRLQLESWIPDAGASVAENYQKTIQLLAWIEDIHRQILIDVKGHTAWYDDEKAEFIPQAIKHDGYAYQDGDVLVEIGSSSISATIATITSTPYRASHALMVRVRNGVKTTLESLLETGVEEFKWEKFINAGVRSLVVLRLKEADPELRKKIAARASDLAYEAAQKQTPYDFDFDMRDSSKMFCNELVLASYVQAINEVRGTHLTVDDLASFASGVKSEKRFQFVEAWGVKNRDMAAPGDLMKSDFFEIVADYKASKNFLDSWKVAIGGQVLMDRIEQGYEVIIPAQIYPLSWVAETASLVTSPFREDKLVPADMPTEALRVTYTLEKIIKDRVSDQVRDEIKNQSLQDHILGISPWELMAMVEYGLDKDSRIQRWFRKKSP